MQSKTRYLIWMVIASAAMLFLVTYCDRPSVVSIVEGRFIQRPVAAKELVGEWHVTSGLIVKPQPGALPANADTLILKASQECEVRRQNGEAIAECHWSLENAAYPGVRGQVAQVFLAGVGGGSVNTWLVLDEKHGNLILWELIIGENELRLREYCKSVDDRTAVPPKDPVGDGEKAGQDERQK